ncbi:uncharacterized protein J3D65DRAFT_615803 [Phyllosticta citribraziliensis]|uniref:VOC domain-containing protein n=1 Tax=Phyllosticta citribraziliensis TaxID=989973 RepID=A0ABR1LZH5_9PEZI
MPVSHIGLTVSHLPTSCSFFLAALQPLGYRFLGQQGNQIGLGINNEADFFICQETPGIKAGAAHIAFSAPDRIAVRDFYTAALTAGGRPHGSPATRDQENGVFNAAVLDVDGNSIEVVFRESVDPRDDTQSAVGGQSRVLTWRKSVSESLGDGQSVVSAKSASKTAMVPFKQMAQSVVSSARSQSIAAPSVAPSQSISQAPTMIRTSSAPAQPQAPTHASKELNPELMADAGARKIIGTLIGAAAGAAVAYAMVKSERDSAREESDWVASQRAASSRPPSAKAPSPQPQQPVQYTYTASEVQRMVQYEQPQSRRNYSETDSFYSHPHQQRAIEAPPARSAHAPTLVSALQAGNTSVRQQQSPHRNFSETESRYSTPDSRERYARAALEAAPVSAKAYLNPTCQSVAQSSPHDEAVDYIPAGSAVAKSHFSINRSVTAPSIVSQTKKSAAPSAVASKPPSSHAPSKAPSKSPSKLVADDAASTARRSSAPSTHSHSSKQAPDADRRSSAGGSKHASRAATLISSFVPDYADAASPSRRSSTGGSKASTAKPSATGGAGAERAPSLLGSALGRAAAAAEAAAERAGESDNDTVAPSDSISNAGSSPSSRRSRTGGGGSKVSRHSSRHSHHSHSHSRRGSRDAGASSASTKDKDKDRRSSAGSRKSSRAGVSEDAAAVQPDAVSEASTVKPRSVRKDSVVSVSSAKSSPSKAGSKRGSKVEA